MLLEAQKISFQYAGNTILQDFSLALRPGNFTMLLGPNGSGKSTALKLLAGFLSPNTGVVFLNQKPLNTIPHRQRARKLAVVPQSMPPVLDYTVAEMVLMGRHAYLSRLSPSAEDDNRIVWNAMEQLGLLALQNHRCNQLSGGERQRVAIAAALAQQPAILLLDEPTSALDPAHTFKVMEILKSLSSQCGILMISHDLNLALRYAKDVLLLRKGKTIASGFVHDIITTPNIEKIYQCHAKLYLSQTESHISLMPAEHPL